MPTHNRCTWLHWIMPTLGPFCPTLWLQKKLPGFQHTALGAVKLKQYRGSKSMAVVVNVVSCLASWIMSIPCVEPVGCLNGAKLRSGRRQNIVPSFLHFSLTLSPFLLIGLLGGYVQRETLDAEEKGGRGNSSNGGKVKFEMKKSRKRKEQGKKRRDEQPRSEIETLHCFAEHPFVFHHRLKNERKKRHRRKKRREKQQKQCRAHKLLKVL